MNGTWFLPALKEGTVYLGYRFTNNSDTKLSLSGGSGMLSGSAAPSTSGSASLRWPPSQGTPAPLGFLPPSPSSAAGENCLLTKFHSRGFPGGSVDKKSACSAEDLSLIPGSGRSPGEGHSNPLQYSCLENSMDRGA